MIIYYILMIILFKNISKFFFYLKKKFKKLNKLFINLKFKIIFL